MVSLKGPHGSHEFFFVAATGILIWSQWKNSEGVKIREIREIRVRKQKTPKESVNP